MLKQLRRRLVWGLLVAIVTLALFVSPVFAAEGHGHGAGGGLMAGGLLWWGLISLGGIFGFIFVSRYLLVRRQVAAAAASGSEQLGYFQAIKQFSRNSKLFLTYSILADLGSGIWGVMFNLYLLRMDYPVTFIGTYWLINMICHGAASLPVGILSDRYGRRRIFFAATFINLTAQLGMLFSTEFPVAILILAAVAGFGEAAHGVVGAPFMMDNSQPKERAHLFSLNAAFLQSSRFGGSLLGGFLPLLWASMLGIPNVDPSAARWALVVGPPLTLMAMVPLMFMREKPVEHPHTLRELMDLGKLPSRRIIAQFGFLGILTGAATLGLTVRFFNVFFEDAHSASDGQIGTILGLGAIAGAGAVLVAPIVAQRWGKVKSIVFTQVASTPFLLMMALVPSLSAVMVLFLVRGAVQAVSQPMRNQLNMELITPRERGTAAGFTHMAFDLGGGVGAGIAGVVIAAGGYTAVFVASIALVLVAAALYYVFFLKEESRAGVAVPVPVPAGGSS